MIKICITLLMIIIECNAWYVYYHIILEYLLYLLYTI